MEQSCLADKFVNSGFMVMTEEAADNELMNIEVDLALSESAESYILKEEAKFSFLPRFKEKEEYKFLYKDVEAAERLLNQEGVSSGSRAGKIALRILDLIWNVGDVLVLPTCLLIFPIIGYLIDRLVEWGIQLGKEAVARKDCEKTIVKLGKLKKMTDDKQVKAACDKEIEKLKKASDKLYMS